jgi:hypothetical protein
LTQGICDGAMGVSFPVFLRFSILKETPMTPAISALPHE